MNPPDNEPVFTTYDGGKTDRNVLYTETSGNRLLGSLLTTLSARTSMRCKVKVLSTIAPLSTVTKHPEYSQEVSSQGFPTRREQDEHYLCGDFSATYTVAVADEREGVTLLSLSGGVLCGGMGMASFTPIAADACVRSVVAASMWREGKVVGVDGAGQIFVLHNRWYTRVVH